MADYFIPVAYPDATDPISGLPLVPFAGHAGFIYVNGDSKQAVFIDISNDDGIISSNVTDLPQISFANGSTLSQGDLAPAFQSILSKGDWTDG